MKKEWKFPQIKNLAVELTNEEDNRTSCEEYQGPEIPMPRCISWELWVENVCPNCCIRGRFCWCPSNPY